MINRILGLFIVLCIITLIQSYLRLSIFQRNMIKQFHYKKLADNSIEGSFLPKNNSEKPDNSTFILTYTNSNGPRPSGLGDGAYIGKFNLTKKQKYNQHTLVDELGLIFF